VFRISKISIRPPPPKKEKGRREGKGRRKRGKGKECGTIGAQSGGLGGEAPQMLVWIFGKRGPYLNFTARACSALSCQLSTVQGSASAIGTQLRLLYRIHGTVGFSREASEVIG